MKNFWLAFIPLFVAVDALGVLPIFMGLTSGLKPKKTKAVVLQSVLTAAIVGLVFIGIGEGALRVLGITIADFMIAGGAVLFVISLRDLLVYEKKPQHIELESLGAVPIGVPLIAGPAVLTTSILLVRQFGILVTGIALTVNILIAGLVFWFSEPINKFLGKAGSRTVSKLANLLLAAIAVMVVRKGLIIILTKTP